MDDCLDRLRVVELVRHWFVGWMVCWLDGWMVGRFDQTYRTS